MLHSQDSLHSGPSSPVSLAAADITTLLPCDEDDSACGREPRSRAALEGTPPAIENPSLIRDANRSLFATLMQIHHFWGMVGRRAVSYSKSSRPWEPTSEFSSMANRLREWEQSLPREHTWSSFLLKRYKAEGQDLVSPRAGGLASPACACRIVAHRRSGLSLRDDDDEALQHRAAQAIPDRVRTWIALASLIPAQQQLTRAAVPSSPTPGTLKSRPFLPSFPGSFSATCGSSTSRSTHSLPTAPLTRALARRLLRFASTAAASSRHISASTQRVRQALFLASPRGRLWRLTCLSAVCQDDGLARDGPGMLQRVIAILRECKEVWPLAARWVDALERFSLDPQSDTLAQEGSMDDGKDPVPRAIRQVPSRLAVPTSRQGSAPALPDNAPPPKPGTQADMAVSTAMPAPHNGMASSLGPTANGQMPTPPNHQQYPTPHLQPLHQGGLPPLQQASFPEEQAMRPPHHQIPVTHQVYMPPQQTAPQLGRQPVDGLGMLIEAFDTHQPGGAPFSMSGPAGAAAPYYPQLGPGNDGFEGELQFYIDGPPSSWLNAGAWLDTV